MNYQELYAQKKMTADEVAAQVGDNWLISMDAAIAQTPAIMDAISRRAENSSLNGVRIQLLLDAYPYAFLTDDHLKGKVTAESWFAGTGLRKAVARRLHPELLPRLPPPYPRQL